MPTLYLLVGYPGAGKTTVSKTLHKLTGAQHLWADRIRKEQFKGPHYTAEENTKLYDSLNHLSDELLAAGKDVIFDTNFNFYKDRQKLRKIAADNNAQSVLLWVQAPKPVAKQRATTDAHKQDSRVLGNMSEADFERLTNHLEEPRADENAVIIDGTKVSPEYLASVLFKK